MAGEERPLTGLSLLEAPVPQPGRGCVIVRQSNKEVRSSRFIRAAEHPITAEKIGNSKNYIIGGRLAGFGGFALSRSPPL